MDREKVIKEWESVLSRDPLDAPWDLIDETLALLKKQNDKMTIGDIILEIFAIIGIDVVLFIIANACGLYD